MFRPAKTFGFAFLVLAACSDFPDLDVALNNTGSAAAFPRLIPIDPLLAAADIDSSNTQAQVATLARRVSLLRARAHAMQGPVIDRRTRRIMAAALRRHVQ